MEAQLVEKIPTGAQWQYEPKWDGFRCLVFRDGDEVELQSKAGQPLHRYFPELVEAVRALPAVRFVLDGEIVIPKGETLSFDDLLQRIHPAESRVRLLAETSPAWFIAFDLLVEPSGDLLTALPLESRRPRLEAFFRGVPAGAPLRLSPATRELSLARQWLAGVGGSLDGIVAKRADLPYLSGERRGMQKIKAIRSAECVVGGFRYGSGSKVVGSLLLGLYDDAGLLHHVGFTSGLRSAEKKELTARLEALVQPPGFTGRAPGGPSRWSRGRSQEWQPLKPELVVEVTYDHFTGGRFRHGTSLLRWRPDKPPRECTLDQVVTGTSGTLRLLEGSGSDALRRAA
ncbi:MAG: ATP-dependent DNA ligase [Armatimonadota bacterium]